MLRVLSWLARFGAFGLIGFGIFLGSPVTGGLLTAQIAGFALSGALMVLWAVAEFRSLPRLQAISLVALAILTGALCTSEHASSFVGLALIAVLDASNVTSTKTSWVVSGGSILAVEVGGLVSGTTLSTLLGYPLLLFAGMLAGQNRRARRVEAEQRNQVAILDERARIAREIHDVLAHSLGALGIQIQAARAVLTDHGDTERALTILSTAQRMATDGLNETRRAVHALRVDPAPLNEQLATIVETHRAQHHTPVTLSVLGDPVDLPPDTALALVRAVQEALVNAAKHATQQPVDVTLRYDDHDVQVTISNPLGTSSEFSTADTGYGLTGMRERLLLLRGTLTAGADDGRWTLHARVPV
ncbi:signal transduction histidine kinase [Kibdelosporangium banguiense]|uniref:histidine kinase n=1 Tax=Kibdelosporangium banguiense TaxID=1365924 RepID=A0ABS4T6D6_9PSEU|nr:histidine kinase [Kibdelosporangium banguiense]MBP2319984.1 signal transduction histidine kinase [Kibdelosporangium banguiense]